MGLLRTHWIFFTCWVTLVVATVVLVSHDEIGPGGDASVAVIEERGGEVNFRPETLLLWRSVQTGQGFMRGDRLATGANGHASLTLADGRTLLVAEDSLIFLGVDNAASAGSGGGDELVLVVTVAKGSIVVRDSPDGGHVKEARSRNGGVQGRASAGAARMVSAQALEIRVGNRAVRLQQAGDELEVIRARPGEPARIQASARVLATAREAPAVAPAIPSPAHARPAVPPSSPELVVTEPLSSSERGAASLQSAALPVKPTQALAQRTDPGTAVTPGLEPLSLDGYQAEIDVLGHPLATRVSLWTDIDLGASLGRLLVSLKPPQGREAPRFSWTPIVEFGGQIVAGDEGWQAHTVTLPVTRDAVISQSHNVTGNVYLYELRRGVKVRVGDRTSQQIDPRPRTISIQSIAELGDQSVRVWLDMRGPSRVPSSSWIIEEGSLGSTSMGKTWQVAVARGRDLQHLWPTLQRARAIKIEAVSFGDSSLTATPGVWVVRDRRLVARLDLGGDATPLAIDGLTRSLGGDLAFEGVAGALVEHPSGLAPGTSRLWIVNRAYGVPHFGISGRFALDNPGVGTFVERVGMAIFRQPVKVISNRLREQGASAH